MKKTRLLALLLACVMLAGLLPCAAAAQTVTYLDANGVTQTATLRGRIGSGGSPYNLDNGWWLLDADCDLGIVQITGADVNLVLADGCTLTACSVRLTQGRKLTVYAQSADEATMGCLHVAGRGLGGSYAAIGAYEDYGNRYAAGELVVNGGRITAEDSPDAGIGSITVYNAAADDYEELGGGVITVNAGIVTAVGSALSPGIGGKNATVTINGGTVNATGYPGIGGDGATVTINGGKVTAEGATHSAGIGGPQNRPAAQLTLRGGTVNATGGTGAAGIGGGQYSAGTVTVTGGAVTAQGGLYGAGLGGGENSGGTVRVTGGTVNAAGGSYGAAIGGGRYGYGDVELSGGTVNCRDHALGGGYNAGGAILLDWTDSSDNYAAKFYRGEVRVENGKQFATEDGALVSVDLLSGGFAYRNVKLIPARFQLTLEANNGSGRSETRWISGAPFALPDCGFSAPSGQYFHGWQTGGVLYAAGTTFAPTADTVLTAIWGGLITVSSVTLSTDSDLNDLTVGDQFRLTAEVLPANAHNRDLTWSSDDPAVALVDSLGRVTCRDLGTTVIRASAADGSGAVGTATLRVTRENGRRVNYLDGQGALQTARNVLPALTTAEWGGGWYVAEGNVEIYGRVEVSGNLHLILADGCDLYVHGGIFVPDSASFTVYGQSTGSRMGKLHAINCTSQVAAIGGNRWISSGVITINGGEIEATALVNGAGIGGGANSDGTVVIRGGKITATGGSLGAGIGGGNQCSGCVTITGGEITANGGDNAGGIGGGNGGGGTVKLSWTDPLKGSITASGFRGDVTLLRPFKYRDDGTAATLPLAGERTLVPMRGQQTTVTYRIVNGTWADGTTGDRTEQLQIGAAPTQVPTGMLPSAGNLFGRWDVVPSAQTTDSNAVFTYAFGRAIITFDTGGIGTPPDPMESSWSGTSGNGRPDKDWFGDAAYTVAYADEDGYAQYEIYDPEKGTVRWFLDPNDESTGVAYWDWVDGDVTLYCKWVRAERLLNEVDLLVTPQAGDPIPADEYLPDGERSLSDFGMPVPDSADYTVAWARWDDEDNDRNFVAGKTYALRVMLATGDSDSTDLWFKGHNSARNPDGTFDPAKTYTLNVNGEAVNNCIDSVDPTYSTFEYLYTVPESDHVYFVAHSLLLKDDVGVVFYVDLHGADPADAVVDFRRTVEQADGSSVERTETVRLSDLQPIAQGETYAGCYKVPVHVAAKEMTDLIHATLTVGGVTVKRSQYSVMTYASKILTDNSFPASDELRALARAMLIYGAQSQLAFGYKTYFKADWDLGSYTLTPPTGLVQNSVPDLRAFGVKLAATSLVLRSRIAYRLYFDVTDPEKFNALHVTLDGTDLVWRQKGGLYYLELSGVAAKNLLDTFTLTFSDGTETATATVGVQDYVATVLRGDDAVLKDTVTALYDYGAAAAAYFRSLQN